MFPGNMFLYYVLIEKFKEMKLLAPGDTVVISGNEKGKEDKHAYTVSFVVKVK